MSSFAFDFTPDFYGSILKVESEFAVKRMNPLSPPFVESKKFKTPQCEERNEIIDQFRVLFEQILAEEDSLILRVKDDYRYMEWNLEDLGIEFVVENLWEKIKSSFYHDITTEDYKKVSDKFHINVFYLEYEEELNRIGRRIEREMYE